MVARRAHNPKVIGSSPVSATKNQSECEERERSYDSDFFLYTKIFTARRVLIRQLADIGSSPVSATKNKPWETEAFCFYRCIQCMFYTQKNSIRYI